MTSAIDNGHVSHLADNERPASTACGEPWQGWQAPSNLTMLDPKAFTLAPHDPPRPHIESVRLCRACQRRAAYEAVTAT